MDVYLHEFNLELDFQLLAHAWIQEKGNVSYMAQFHVLGAGGPALHAFKRIKRRSGIVVSGQHCAS